MTFNLSELSEPATLIKAPATAGLHACNVSLSLSGRRILEDVNVAVSPGKVTAILGPNGAGKSTLLKIFSGELTPQSGAVILNGRPLAAWSLKECARQRAVLPQTPELAFSFRAWDVVDFGRYPHQGHATPAENHSAVQGSMAAAEVSQFAGRDCGTLSGGEVHRIHYARSLAQIWTPLAIGRDRILLLDEPTSSLDLFHQHAILAKARDMAQSGVGVLAVLHDLNLAAAYADTLVVLAGGKVDAIGSPAVILTKERISRIWRVDCDITHTPGGIPQIMVAPYLRVIK